MKVITWNLGYWEHKDTQDEAWSYLRKTIRPDLALLQEIRPPELMTGEALVFQEAHRGWGTAIYSRELPLDNVPLWEDPGRVIGASVSLPNGDRLHLASIHAKTQPAVFPRLANIMEEITETFADRTAVVGGDLNSARLAEDVSPGNGNRQFWERMDSDSSSLVDSCQRINGKELQTTFRKDADYTFQEDYLFVSRDILSGLEGCNVIDTKETRRWSDHIPLFSELAI
ncbi:MAG: hypothetical protein V3U33_08505 [candidate division NC10 bacterium]